MKKRRTIRRKSESPLSPSKPLVFPKSLYEAFAANINMEDEEASEKHYETVYKPLRDEFLGDKATDRLEQCRLAQRLSALKLKHGE